MVYTMNSMLLKLTQRNGKPCDRSIIKKITKQKRIIIILSLIIKVVVVTVAVTVAIAAAAALCVPGCIVPLIRSR